MSKEIEINNFFLSTSSNNGEELEDSGLFSAKTEYPLDEAPKDSKINLNVGNDYSESVPSKSTFSSKQNSSSNYITSSRGMKDCSQMADIRDKLTTTFLEVESFDQNGKRESLRATLESTTNLGGVLEMDNSSNLRLKLQCFSGNNNTNEPRTKIQHSQSLFSIPPVVEVTEPEEPIRDNLPKISTSQYTQKISQGKEVIVNNIKRIYSHIIGQKDQ